AVMRRLVKVPSFTMPNLIAGRSVVPEFLQEAARPEAVADAVCARLAGPVREAQLRDLEAVRAQLGEGGAAERAAGIAMEMVRGAAGP
ncbi:MAG: lipid-A-disaccharide synthase, partial [Myxococcota bacterium]|nr:lipid-A-disaccharide synthase [Myxococcota bacterium]